MTSCADDNVKLEPVFPWPNSPVWVFSRVRIQSIVDQVGVIYGPHLSLGEAVELSTAAKQLRLKRESTGLAHAAGNCNAHGLRFVDPVSGEPLTFYPAETHDAQ